jgi:hypothetical protein
MNVSDKKQNLLFYAKERQRRLSEHVAGWLCQVELVISKNKS